MKALQSPNPEMIIDRFGKFLSGYWTSELLLRKGKKYVPKPINSRQREAYSFLAEIQRTRSKPLRLQHEDLTAIVDIYFKD